MNNFAKVKALIIGTVLGLSYMMASFSGVFEAISDFQPLELDVAMMSNESIETVSTEDAWNTALEIVNQN